MKTTTCFFVLAFSLYSITVAQPSGPMYMTAGILSGNRVMTAFGNWGVIGQPAQSGSRGAWISPTNGYIGDMSIFVGLELPFRDYNGDGTPDTVHSVITCPVSRPALTYDVDPITGMNWAFEPDSGYCNVLQQSPAIRSQRWTWPDSWPDHPAWGTGKWNGLRGPDSLTGDDEAFFRMDDQNDERFNVATNNPRGITFHPDSINPARRGQGISVGVRYIQSASPLFRDIFFRAYDITNEGTTDYSKVVFGTLTGTYIGVTSTDDSYQEYDNDIAVYFPSSDFILAWNSPEDKVRNPLWQGPVGKFGEAFVETPSGDHIASCDVFDPSNQISLGDDESLWGRLKPGRYAHPASTINDTVATAGGDIDYLYGSNYFALKSGETKRVVATVVYGYQKEEIKWKILLAKALWNSRFQPDAALNAVSITNFSTHRFLAGPQSIQWTTAQGGGTVFIWYSADAGSSWSPVAAGIPNTGSTMWNTGNFPDAAFGVLRIIAADSTGRLYGFHETSSYFTVDNPGNGTPFVRILDTTLSAGAMVTQPEIGLPLLIGDPEWGPLGVTLFYRVSADAPFIPFESYTAASDTSVQYHTVSLVDLPNSSSLQLKVVVSDGVGMWGDSTAAFDKRSMRPFFPTDRVQFSGLSQVPINVLIDDSSRVRSDTYLTTFCDTAFSGPKTFSVWDNTRRSWLLNGAPFYPRIESASFDGLTFYAPDITTVPDSARTRWNRTVPGVSRGYSIGVSDFPAVSYTGYRQPYDYRIVFNNNIVDTTAPFDVGGLTPTPVTFRVYNMQTNEKVKAAAWMSYGIAEIVFLENILGHERATWDLFLNFYPPDSSAHSGDTLYLFTKKGLSIHDTLTIQGITLYVPPTGGVPSAYALYQNYPNPFNPSTTIKFELPRTAYVTLGVYDILGRQVSVLVNERRNAGVHEVKFDGSGLSSGVYFCRIEAGSFVQTRKLLLLR